MAEWGRLISIVRIVHALTADTYISYILTECTYRYGLVRLRME